MSETENLQTLKSLIEKLAEYKVGQTVYVSERILDDNPKVRAVRVGRIGFDGDSMFKYYDEHGAPIGYAGRLAASLDELKAANVRILEDMVGKCDSMHAGEVLKKPYVEFYGRYLEAWRNVTGDDVIKREE